MTTFRLKTIKRWEVDNKDYEHCNFHIPEYDGGLRKKVPTIQITYGLNESMSTVIIICDECWNKLRQEINIFRSREVASST